MTELTLLEIMVWGIANTGASRDQPAFALNAGIMRIVMMEMPAQLIYAIPILFACIQI